MANEQLGKWAFIIGLILAIVIAFVQFRYDALIVFVLGLIAGAINVSAKSVVEVLVAAIAYAGVGVVAANAASVLGTLGTAGTYIAAILSNSVVLVGGIAIIVAGKAVYELSAGK